MEDIPLLGFLQSYAGQKSGEEDSLSAEEIETTIHWVEAKNIRTDFCSVQT